MLKFKEVLLEEEFLSADKRLQVVVYALASFVQHRFNKDIIVTSVYRGGNKLSVHAHWRGVDLRVTPEGGKPIYTKRELDSIKAFCNRFQYSTDLSKRYKTIKVHDSGSGLHIHLQVSGENQTRIAR